MQKQGVLLVLSGPTCAGKDTVMRELLKRNKNLVRLVTTNTRAKRSEEQEGVDYHFVSREEFEKLIAEGAFFEWVEYRGGYRGGQKKHVQEALNSGKDVIWRIETKGVKNIRPKVKQEIPGSVFVMLRAPLSILEKRAKMRQTEDKYWRDWSLDLAKWEMAQTEDFDYIVENEEEKVEETVKKIEKIIADTRKNLLTK